MLLKPVYTFVILLLGLYLTRPAMADEFILVKQLLKQNKPQQAYRMLTKQEELHLGEPEYDFLLGRTALAAGHPNEAIFAFERVLMSNPNNHYARVELAVAYYQINELERAQQQFAQAQAARPPDVLNETIDIYLSRIEEKISGRKHKLNGEVTLKQGWDSNINSATNESEIQLADGFPTYKPTAGVDKQTSDSFTEVINRLNYNYHFNINSEIFSSVGYTNRENNHKQFDTQTADAKLGYRQTTALGRISIPLSYQTMWLDEVQLQEVKAMGANLKRSGDNSFTDYTLQYGEIRYPYRTGLDMDYVTATFALGTTDNKAVVNQQYAFFYGDESPTNSLYKFNAREYMGMQIRLPLRLSQSHYLIPAVVYQVAEYKKLHPIFDKKRTDHYASAELNWRWYFNRQWSLTSQLSRTESDSTVALYTYTRNIISTGIMYAY